MPKLVIRRPTVLEFRTSLPGRKNFEELSLCQTRADLLFDLTNIRNIDIPANDVPNLWQNATNCVENYKSIMFNCSEFCLNRSHFFLSKFANTSFGQNAHNKIRNRT